MPRILTPSIETLRRVVEDRSYVYFIWPGEVIMPDDLPAEEVKARADKGEVQAMLVDDHAADVVVKVYDNLSPELKEKVAKMVANSRKEFAYVVLTGWKHLTTEE